MDGLGVRGGMDNIGGLQLRMVRSAASALLPVEEDGEQPIADASIRPSSPGCYELHGVGNCPFIPACDLAARVGAADASPLATDPLGHRVVSFLQHFGRCVDHWRRGTSPVRTFPSLFHVAGNPLADVSGERYDFSAHGGGDRMVGLAFAVPRLPCHGSGQHDLAAALQGRGGGGLQRTALAADGADGRSGGG